MKILPYLRNVVLSLVGLVAVSCDRDLETGNDFSKEDKEFIKTLGILDDGEKVVLFDSQGGSLNPLRASGNFFTYKRIASYWIDDRDSAKTNIDYAFYSDIDTIHRYPKYKSLTLASYLEVHKRDGTKFKVYVSGDSAKTWKFFNTALKQWSEIHP